MKKALYATAGSALALVLLAAALPASADVNVTATITKNKDITVIENITVNKTVSIVVNALLTPEAAAEAQALANVTNDHQTVNGPRNAVGTAQNPVDLSPSTPTVPNGGNHIPKVTDFHLTLSAVMTGSAKDNTGVWGFNQDVGNMTNQGNVVSVAGIVGCAAGEPCGTSALLPAFADAQAEVDQANTDNLVIDIELLRNAQGEVITSIANLPSAPNGFHTEKEARIANSILGNTGVMNVNQNAGNMNNQTNAVAVAVGLGAQVAMTESALGQQNSGNEVYEIDTVKRDTISGSINDNTGIVNVNQSTGNMNNQSNTVSLAASFASGNILGDAHAGTP
jgi:hypothetical protein